MNGDISASTIYPFLFIIASGYVTLLWGYRDAGLLNHFYDGLKEFDKIVQTTFTGVLIYIIGYYLSPSIFIQIFKTTFPLDAQFIFAAASIEILLIMIVSSFVAGVVWRAHEGFLRR